MRQLTFPGFLDQYVRKLSEDNTGALYALTRETVSGNYRLKEPLFLFAIATGREKTLLKASRGTVLENEFEHFQKQYSYSDLVKSFQMVPCTLPNGYQKVWKSYLSEANSYERDSRVKELSRKRVLALQKSKGITTYRVCKDLRLNNSNVNAWLKNGVGSKVSLETARSILEYAERYQAN